MLFRISTLSSFIAAPGSVSMKATTIVTRGAGHRNGYRLDAATGLGVGWDGTASGCFVGHDGHSVAIICGYWDFEDWNPAPGERGFHEWVRYADSHTLVGVMYLPRPSPT